MPFTFAVTPSSGPKCTLGKGGSPCSLLSLPINGSGAVSLRPGLGWVLPGTPSWCPGALPMPESGSVSPRTACTPVFRFCNGSSTCLVGAGLVPQLWPPAAWGTSSVPQHPCCPPLRGSPPAGGGGPAAGKQALKCRRAPLRYLSRAQPYRQVSGRLKIEEFRLGQAAPTPVSWVTPLSSRPGHRIPPPLLRWWPRGLRLGVGARLAGHGLQLPMSGPLGRKCQLHGQSQPSWAVSLVWAILG